MTEALEQIIPTDAKSLDRFLAHSPSVERLTDFVRFIEERERKLTTFKEFWPSHREEGLDIALTEDQAEPFDMLIKRLEFLEAKSAEFLRELRAAISRHPFLPPYSTALVRLEDFLASAAETFRDARWDTMALRANRPSSVAGRTSFHTLADLRQAVGRKK